MVDFRLYRAAFLPALVALVIVAFSLDGVPEPISSGLAPSVLQAREAVSTARQIATRAPSRPPGSDGDAAVGDLVERRFSEIPSGTVSEQNYDSNYSDEDVSLRNVILTLPGETDSTIVICAARDSATEPGAASSAAATGVLIELARALAATDHDRTIVVVSTDGGADGASGARNFIENYENRDSIESTLVVSQPGAADPGQPFLVTSSVGSNRTSLQLSGTAGHEIDIAVGKPSTEESSFTQLARLAFPSGLGEQAVLIDQGIEAVAVSSAGEKPLPAANDTIDDLSPTAVADFGRAALATVLALDGSPAPPKSGPDSYIVVGSNVLPGGSLAFLALTLLLPAGVAAADALARASRDAAGSSRAMLWAGSLAAPPLAALVLLYLMALIGLVPLPAFPFDPALYGIGFTELLALVVLAAVVVGGYLVLGVARPPRATRRQALVPATGLMLFASSLIAWFTNPFLGLLLVPLCHAWLPAAARPVGRIGSALALLVAAVPLGAAIATAAAAIGAGIWDATLIVADGQIGALTCASLSLVAGAALGLIVASGSVAGSGRGPGGNRGVPPEETGAR
jgi:hypothetical protein